MRERLRRWRIRNAVADLCDARLELDEAEYRVRVWGFADSPRRRAEKKERIKAARRRVRVAERRLANLRGDAGPDATRDTSSTTTAEET